MDAIRKFLLQGRYVSLFCRIEKLPSAPPDIYRKDGWINTKAHPDVQQVQQTTDGIFRIWRRIDDKGNQEQIIEAVRSQLEYFQATYPDEDIQPFIDGQIETIRELEDELFPNHNRGNINHYNGYKNLQAYKRALRGLAHHRIWQGVFHSDNEYEKFLYLHENYSNTRKTRWSFLYFALYQGFKIIHLQSAPFLRWVQEHYAPEMKTVHKQDHVKEMDDELKELVSKYPHDT